ncbi:zinc finger, CCHC-type containing protein [Tanacetum coccineum]
MRSLKRSKCEVENQIGKTIKALRSDRGGEDISQKFKDYLKANGIVQQLTPSYTPQHNRVSERRNRTLLDMGCEALVKRETPDKLKQRSVKCIFIGYLKETMEIGGRVVDLEEIQEEEDTTPSEITSNIPQEVEGFELPQTPQEEVILILNLKSGSKSNKWIDAINAKIQSMIDNMVWVLIDLPPGCKTVASKWLFKKNTDMDGIVHIYKARLVTKVYTQLYGVDYEETFSPVADIRAIRILISKYAYYDYEIWQIDVKTAFLNGYLDEDIYMVQPEERLDLNRSQGAQTPKELNRMKNVPYASAVRSIMYAVRCTRPDVAFAQNITSRFQQNSGELHWTAVKNILKYDTKSQTGYVFVLNGGAVDWKSSKQSTIAMSATESEYIAASEACMKLFDYGTSAALGEIKILKVHTDNNLADPFTKSLSNKKLTQHATSMGLRPASSFM